MIKLPITLSDEQTKIRSTIKSLDAEKIFPFRASEIQKSEDEGQSIINDISIAIDNMEIVCFVKCYDKVIVGEKTRRYVVLKTYTLDEVHPVAVEDALEIPKDDVLTPGSSHIRSTSHTVTSSSLHKEAESHVSFFTRTTA